MNLKKYYLVLLAVLFAVLHWMAWPARGLAPLLFISWVPLLFLENHFIENPALRKRKFFWLTWLAFFLFNILTTWWVYFASAFGAAMAIILNSLFMSITVFIFHLVHRKFRNPVVYVFLITIWITWEWLHLDWDLSWPWLTMGNGLAAYCKWIQWYEYTGVFGGTIWILLSNILIFHIIKNYHSSGVVLKKLSIIWLSLIALPIALSIAMYYNYEEKVNPVNVVVLQPNIDPYNEKFGGMSGQDQLKKMLAISSEFVDSTTDYLIGPETSIPYSVWEDRLNSNQQIQFLKSYVKAFPKLTIITGAATNQHYDAGAPHSATARKFAESEEYYDSYNTALQIDTTPKIELYHKSKLVPGVEKMPFSKLLKPIEKIAFDLGGTSGSLGVQKEPSVFMNKVAAKKTIVGPIICYESIYGEYVGKYVQKGATVLFIITNDGWWYDTPGYRQHLQYGRMRAIEMRRSIARSANTGTSAIINQRGDVEQATDFWVPAAIKASINANDKITFYAKHGDYLAEISAALSVLILLSSLVLKSKNN